MFGLLTGSEVARFALPAPEAATPEPAPIPAPAPPPSVPHILQDQPQHPGSTRSKSLSEQPVEEAPSAVAPANTVTAPMEVPAAIFSAGSAAQPAQLKVATAEPASAPMAEDAAFEQQEEKALPDQSKQPSSVVQPLASANPAAADSSGTAGGRSKGLNAGHAERSEKAAQPETAAAEPPETMSTPSTVAAQPQVNKSPNQPGIDPSAPALPPAAKSRAAEAPAIDLVSTEMRTDAVAASAAADDKRLAQDEGTHLRMPAGEAGGQHSEAAAATEPPQQPAADMQPLPERAASPDKAVSSAAPAESGTLKSQVNMTAATATSGAQDTEQESKPSLAELPERHAQHETVHAAEALENGGSGGAEMQPNTLEGSAPAKAASQSDRSAEQDAALPQSVSGTGMPTDNGSTGMGDAVESDSVAPSPPSTAAVTQPTPQPQASTDQPQAEATAEQKEIRLALPVESEPPPATVQAERTKSSTIVPTAAPRARTGSISSTLAARRLSGPLTGAPGAKATQQQETPGDQKAAVDPTAVTGQKGPAGSLDPLRSLLGEQQSVSVPKSSPPASAMQLSPRPQGGLGSSAAASAPLRAAAAPQQGQQHSILMPRAPKVAFPVSPPPMQAALRPAAVQRKDSKSPKGPDGQLVRNKVDFNPLG